MNRFRNEKKLFLKNGKNGWFYKDKCYIFFLKRVKNEIVYSLVLK